MKLNYPSNQGLQQQLARFREQQAQLQQAYADAITELAGAKLTEARRSKKQGNEVQHQQVTKVQQQARVTAEKALQQKLKSLLKVCNITGSGSGFSAVQTDTVTGEMTVTHTETGHTYKLQKEYQGDSYTLTSENPDAPKDYRHYVLSGNGELGQQA